jgi:hypothetical protein
LIETKGRDTPTNILTKEFPVNESMQSKQLNINSSALPKNNGRSSSFPPNLTKDTFPYQKYQLEKIILQVQIGRN